MDKPKKNFPQYGSGDGCFLEQDNSLRGSYDTLLCKEQIRRRQQENADQRNKLLYVPTYANAAHSHCGIKSLSNQYDLITNMSTCLKKTGRYWYDLLLKSIPNNLVIIH